MIKNKFYYSVPRLEKMINWSIDTIFYYRLIFVTAAFAVLFYLAFKVWNLSDAIDNYKNIAIVFSLGSIVIGIFYSILNYEHNYIKYKNDIRTTKLALSYSASSEWHKPTMVENLKITKLLYDEYKNLTEDNKAVDFFNILEKDESARSALVSILNYFESISLGIRHELMDEEYMRNYFKTVYSLYLNNYGFYINHRRRMYNSPEIWINFTNLAEDWKKGR